MIRTLSFLTLITFAIISCSPEEKGNVSIEGKIDNAPNQTEIYLFHISQSTQAVDTAAFNEDGTFKMVYNVDKPGYYRLGFNKANNYASLILQPNDKITVNGTSGNLEGYAQVKGSKDAEDLQQMLQIQMSYYTKADSLKRAMQYAQQNKDPNSYRAAVTTLQNARMTMMESMKTFIQNHEGSMANLAAIEQLRPNQNFELYTQVRDNLSEKMKGVYIYDRFAQRVQGIEKTAVGSKAPELVFKNPKGETVKLSSLRGEYVLIDFWASWCKPCRAENPNVVKMYNKYKDKGFEIYGVSLDKKRNAWLQAIEQDNIEWVQVSDLKGWQSEAAGIYSVSSIPATFLLNPEGEIIAKNLRGKKLEDKLQEIFES